MKIKWDTKERDLLTAKNVLRSHYEESGSGLVGVQEISITEDGGLHVERSAWVIELERIFEEQYGENAGLDVTRKVLTALITQGETVH